jgi:hypothetical protein
MAGTGFGAGLGASLSGGGGLSSGAGSILGSQANLIQATTEQAKLIQEIEENRATGPVIESFLTDFEVGIKDKSLLDQTGGVNTIDMAGASRLLLRHIRKAKLPANEAERVVEVLGNHFKLSADIQNILKDVTKKSLDNDMRALIKTGVTEEAKLTPTAEGEPALRPSDEAGLVPTATQVALQASAGQGALEQAQTPAGFTVEQLIEQQKARQAGVSKPKTLEFFDPKNPSDVRVVTADAEGRFVAPEGFLPNLEGAIKGLAAEVSGRASLAQQGIGQVENVRDILTHEVFGGKTGGPTLGSFVKAIQFGLGGVTNQQMRQADSDMLNAVQAKLRIETGAAAPEPEKKDVMRRFKLKPLDSLETMNHKLNSLSLFLVMALRNIDPEGRVIDHVSVDDVKNQADEIAGMAPDAVVEELKKFGISSVQTIQDDELDFTQFEE